MLTSRKLAATIAGLVAVCTLAGFASFGDPIKEYEKTLAAVTSITLAAVGIQGALDLAKKLEP